tara:strand:- start:119 stop:409 length:291 start_codon:yes stop_codon:yes gene_type:complete
MDYEKKWNELEQYHFNKELGDKIQRDIDSFVSKGGKLIEESDYSGLKVLLEAYESSFKSDVSRLRFNNSKKEKLLKDFDMLKESLMRTMRREGVIS